MATTAPPYRPRPELVRAALTYAAAKRAAWAELEQAPARTLTDDHRAWAAFHTAVDAAEAAYRAALRREETES